MSTKKIQILGNLFATDETLTQSGAAADSKVVGDAINALNASVDNIPQPDWNQTDETQKDYIKNKPEDLAHTSDIPAVDATLSVEGATADAKATGDAIQSISTLVGDEPVATQITEAIEANKVDLTGYATETYVDTKVAGLVDAAPEALNTLNELSAALGDDPNFATTVATQIGNKAEKEHTHTISELTDIGDASVNHATTADTANAVAWSNVTDKPSTYAPSVHNHAISDVADLQATLDTKVPTTRTVNGKALSENITLNANDVNADVSGSADTALANAKSYTDAEIAEWVGDKTVSAQINSAVSTKADVGHTHDDRYYTETEIDAVVETKANASDLTEHTSNKSNPHGVTLSQLGVTATATELNYVGGVTSNVQTQLNNKISQADMESYINETFLGGAW